ncbi:MAG: Glycosyl transferases group 1 [Chloroflexi bacterium ADurb.Bin360]|nr:MAG: Glycosyl transferases group 1 [Chloroflexi bacterium ADurb.Bin360]
MILPRVHILYEYGHDGRPFGSAAIRLLRPLTHPIFQDQLMVTSGSILTDMPVDAVIVDRLWRPDISLALAQQLREQVSRIGARLFYALDDNFLVLAQERKDWQPTTQQLQALEFFLTQSDGIIVTTNYLKDSLCSYNSRIVVVPNMLDDRLLSARAKNGVFATHAWQEHLIMIQSSIKWNFRRRIKPSVLIGYMGTFTHDDDLLLVLPALQAISQNHRGKVRFEFLGVAAHADTYKHLMGMETRIIAVKPARAGYTHFMPWFTRAIHWDIAISPLRANDFNRCKSDIKFLDYSAIGAAGIYSRVPAYVESVIHGETGWLAENTTEAWVEALETLILEASLRERIAHNAREYLYSKRIVARASQYWLNAFESLLD